MKTDKILYIAGILAFASACSEDTDMTIYQARNNEAFFTSTEQSYIISGEMKDVCEVTVFRANSEGDASVQATVTTEDPELADVFIAPATVDFKDGEISAIFEVSFNREQLEIGVTNQLSVQLQSETQLPYETSCSVTVMRDYTWLLYKEAAEYTSGFFGETWPQTVYVAKESPNLYTLPDLFAEGTSVQFIWDGQSEVISFPYPSDEDGGVDIPTGYDYFGFGLSYLYTFPSTCSYSAETKTISIPVVEAWCQGGIIAEGVTESLKLE